MQCSSWSVVYGKPCFYFICVCVKRVRRLGGLLRGGWLALQTLSDVMAETVGWAITDDGGETRGE